MFDDSSNFSKEMKTEVQNALNFIVAEFNSTLYNSSDMKISLLPTHDCNVAFLVQIPWNDESFGKALMELNSS